MKMSSQKQNKKSCSKTQLDEENLPFHDTLDHFFFLYFSIACLSRRFPYTIKDDSSKEL